MSNSLLEKTRIINKLLQEQNHKVVSFEHLSDNLSTTLNANVYISDTKGLVLGKSYVSEERSPLIAKDGEKGQWFPKSYLNKIKKLNEALENITGENITHYFEDEPSNNTKYLTVLPLFGNGERLGFILFSKDKQAFNDDELVLCEIAAIVVALEVVRDLSQKRDVEAQQIAIVEKAIATLSYSEIEAVQCIFAELKGDEGVLVASKIADRAGITRSVIVNALRKFESAGVINSRSLGMKGTRIKILNERLKPMLNKIK